MRKYFPILLSKAGEFKALKNLTTPVKNIITPVIQLLPTEYEKIIKFVEEDWNFENNQLFLDFSLDSRNNAIKGAQLIKSLNKKKSKYNSSN